ncbi:PAS domain S-box-containing protein/diguanylate cyclase (GGDEF)-like protein [Pseudomonas duriflava]|uniref:PAS domain S-box-containing protein/diguanylate cyclase (GGDEF)-like protein n=1 Tax=Pseudomonas duriflava TaxID=459528 RepID=A0A562QLB4_9PSED|nr:EAL domain-containing protein [Pseudomonas duriflava]TWI57463.1 PAS domain S-box-containing protein/diguanylate cyclase (GGDEF)-like protein [Pseudomonas duriflava]
MLKEFISNVALLICCCWLHSQLSYAKQLRPVAHRVLTGLCFGLIGIAVISYSIPVQPGVIVDTRLVLVSVASLIGGPLVGLVAGTLASLYRFWLGGAGTTSGILNLYMAVGIGLLYRAWPLSPLSTLDKQSPGALFLFGLAIHAVSVVVLNVFNDLGPAFHEETAFLLVLLMPAATAALGVLLKQQQQRRETERSLEEAEAHLRAITEAIPDSLYVLDEDGTYLEAAGSQTRNNQSGSRDKTGKRIEHFFAPDDAQSIRSAIRKSLDGNEPANIEYAYRTAAETRHFEARVQPIHSPTFPRRSVVLVTRDVTQRYEHDAQIKRLAFSDVLTGLANRLYLMNRLSIALSLCKRNHTHAALLFIDLDGFKKINDLYGHDKGDVVLIHVAKRLRTLMRPSDTVVRLGGDEFVILLENLASSSDEAGRQANRVALKALHALREPFQLDQEVQISASIGIALFDEHTALSGEEILKQADLSMYEAKATGKNDICFFDSRIEEALTQRLNLENEIWKGLRQNEFLVFYQPQFNEEGVIIGAEALLRWQHPQWGLVAPDRFLAVAMAAGIMPKLDIWLLEEVCRQVEHWSSHAVLSRIPFAINVCAHHLHQPDFPTTIRDTLHAFHIETDRIKLELTESVLVNDFDQARLHMATLQHQGIGFSLDDFGTGYSSLSYIDRLPFEQLKIDRSFIHRLPNTGSVAIIQSIIQLASGLGIGVIAEGVETSSQRAFLIENGCMYYQGFLFSPPLPANDFAAFASKAANQ